MPHEAAERWNERYQNNPRYSFAQPRPFILENAHLLPRQGIALEVAMGLGGNASLLISLGLRVIGVDISSVAVQRAKERLPELMAVIADLTRFNLPGSYFAVISNFFYLERSLWPDFRRALRPGGILIIETLTQEMRTTHPEIDPAFLLAPGELRAAFSDYEILVYREGLAEDGLGASRATAGLVAHKPPR